MTSHAIEVRNLSLSLTAGGHIVADEVDFKIAAGETLGLVGESGSGKTSVAHALLGHCRRGIEVSSGSVTVAGLDLDQLTPSQLRDTRGRVISYIPQDPTASLNPAIRIGQQLEEMLSLGTERLDKRQRHERIAELLQEVALPADRAFLARYPHEVSGGQLQRIAIAMAFALRPRVVVADEPTTGLDVTTQAHVIDTIRKLRHNYDVAMLYVSHDLAVVAQLCDRVAVMYAGRIVEIGSREQVFDRPAHPYTRRLLRAVPDVDGKHMPVGIAGNAPSPGKRPNGCAFAERCDLAVSDCHKHQPDRTKVEELHEVRCIRTSMADARPKLSALPIGSRQAGETVISISGLLAKHGDKQVLNGVDVTVRRNECVGIVGESGSGKSTLARCIVGLHRDMEGVIELDGEVLPHAARRRSQESRRNVQLIFQNPFASMNPRATVRATLVSRIRLLFDISSVDANRRAEELLETVSLPAAMADRYPHQLSGGERQRVSIARALAADPIALVCDEITSALDVSVQASLIGVLKRLQHERGLSILFITHNLALVRTIADRVVVMRNGSVVENGDTAEMFRNPTAPYTRTLLANTPAMAVPELSLPNTGNFES